MVMATALVVFLTVVACLIVRDIRSNGGLD
jgi:hypothetical protein